MLKKMVNGVEVEMTQEEEAEILAEWESNERQVKATETPQQKLARLGLTVEELKALLK